MRSVRRFLVFSMLVGSGVTACSSDSTTDFFAPLALGLNLSPRVDTIFVSDSITAANSAQLALSATSLGDPISVPAGVEWSSSDPSVAIVDQNGNVFARSIGTATVTARVNSAKASATIVVAYQVTELKLSATSLTGVVGDTVQFTATALDASGKAVPGTIYDFSSADPSVATVTATGVGKAQVVFKKAGTASITVSAGGQQKTVTGAIQPREFISSPVSAAPAGALVLSAGGDATCGLLPLGRAYCFGREQLVGVAKDTVCFGDGGGSEPCTLIPLRVAGQLNMVSVSVGGSVACGAVTDGRVYCWGSQAFGQLGNGVSATGTSLIPTLVLAARSLNAEPLTRVSAGGDHVCGLTPAGQAWCWGRDDLAQLGNGDSLRNSASTPIPVLGSTSYATISAGANHTCALTSTGAAFCWGDNRRGQLGAGIGDTTSDKPVAVVGVSLSSISSGRSHTCGLTAAGVAICWGDNSRGQLGVSVNTLLSSSTPVAVGGGLQFKSISAGSVNTCGITTGGAAYCWGDNSYWQLGTNGGAFSDSPVAVSGGHADFVSVTVGARHACANATTGVYCWGSNIFGALGNELQALRQATPQRVILP